MELCSHENYIFNFFLSNNTLCNGPTFFAAQHTSVSLDYFSLDIFMTVLPRQRFQYYEDKFKQNDTLLINTYMYYRNAQIYILYQNARVNSGCFIRVLEYDCDYTAWFDRIVMSIQLCCRSLQHVA